MSVVQDGLNSRVENSGGADITSIEVFQFFAVSYINFIKEVFNILLNRVRQITLTVWAFPIRLLCERNTLLYPVAGAEELDECTNGSI